MLPDDIDSLVQQVYSDEEYDGLGEQWSQALDETRKDMETRRKEDALKAERILVSEPGYPEDMIAQFNKQLEDDDNPNAHESIKAATRDGDPSIQVVCLRREGARLTAVADGLKIDLDCEPTRRQTEALLASRLPVSKKALYHELCKMDTPEGWKKSPNLRYHRAVEFTDGKTCVGRYRLSLDCDKGLIIERQEEGK